MYDIAYGLTLDALFSLIRGIRFFCAGLLAHDLALIFHWTIHGTHTHMHTQTYGNDELYPPSRIEGDQAGLSHVAAYVFGFAVVRFIIESPEA